MGEMFTRRAVLFLAVLALFGSAGCETVGAVRIFNMMEGTKIIVSGFKTGSGGWQVLPGCHMVPTGQDSCGYHYYRRPMGSPHQRIVVSLQVEVYQEGCNNPGAGCHLGSTTIDLNYYNSNRYHQWRGDVVYITDYIEVKPANVR